MITDRMKYLEFVMYNSFRKVLIALIFIIFTGSFSFASSKMKEISSQKKFVAQKAVRHLTRENLKKLDFIDFISNIYGYKGCDPLKKNYWSAKMEIVRGDIVQARKILEQNRTDIDKFMTLVFDKYKKRSNRVINDGVGRISEFYILTMESRESKIHKKYKKNKDRIDIAINHVELAEKAGKNENYKLAIKHYRNAKSIAIEVLRNLSSSEHLNDIDEKYSLDIKDVESEYTFKGSY